MNAAQDPADSLLRRARAGDRAAVGELIAHHGARLTRIVDLRMDARIRARTDAADIVQESALEALQRFDEFLAQDKMPFFVWLRYLTLQRLAANYRRHLGAGQRDVRREVRLHPGPWPEASSLTLAQHLIGANTSPSIAAARAEQRLQLEQALDSMDPIDREILALRHFEQLSNVETARALDLDASAASKRYLRALRKVRGVLDRMQGPQS